MAKSSPSTPTTAPYTVTQQALNVIRQLLNAKDWCDTLAEAYVGGKLVEKYLPELDDTASWVKTEEQLKAFSPEKLAAYHKLDRAWATKPFTLSLTDKQVMAIKKAFLFFIDRLIKAKGLGPNPVFTEIIDVFGIDPEAVTPKPAAPKA